MVMHVENLYDFYIVNALHKNAVILLKRNYTALSDHSRNKEKPNCMFTGCLAYEGKFIWDCGNANKGKLRKIPLFFS